MQRYPLSGEKYSPNKVWVIQHTRKSASGERVWLDSQSQQIHRSGYVHGKGYGKKSLKKAQIQHADIKASVSSTMKSMRQEMQAYME
ncbi:hypothetical protein H5410_027851 [Solanum commersonii]|uniref:Uncharacterized protein n=1 Tax=Solanum commersonii TaxID=4109 RepID=A0A9J5Z397_SOLCO|nr:hypothetical protein H5410_027851 [Solanum commersonii]